MTLQKRPEANRRYPNVNVLSGFDFYQLVQVYAHHDGPGCMGDIGSREMMAEDAISV
jgi:hypothetical protein